MPIELTRDRSRLRRIFAADPIAAVYQLGDLQEPAFSQSHWWVADERAVLLDYRGLAVPVVLPFGELDALGALFREADLPPRFYVKLTDGQRPLLAARVLSAPEELYVMGLSELRLAPGAAGLRVCRVTEPEPIKALYQHYPGNYFDPAQVASGYYASASLDGRVVAAAGTHAWAPAEGVAALGNVVTAAEYRGRGIARTLVGWLCGELASEGCRHMGLHVHRANVSAIACYRAVGFELHSAITQWLVGAP